jgi:alginate O-acetyltransferase complex protein AlgI
MDLLSGILGYSEDNPMLFTRIYFWVFLLFLLLGYSILYRKNVLRNAWLFFMSLFFYYKSGGYFFSLLVFSTITDYILGLLIYGSATLTRRKLFLTASITINLGLLAYFKYAYFITGMVNQVTGKDLDVVNFLALWYNRVAGGNLDVSLIVLPVGISFFTFQTISYAVDVYTGKTKPVKNIIDFGFYVSFFPQLVAGPIVRAAEFIPQLYSSFRLTIREMGHAVFLIVSGLIKKMIISDYISVNFVDRVFDHPVAYSGFENLMALYGYSVQIYCDFSGYTDIAIGVALLLGFRLPVNFNSPYKAMNVTDFWRRWHISLSSWLRDYLYIPLGGNKKGVLRNYENIMVTMLLGGLWHGANLRFVLWGGLHGLALVAHKMWTGLFPPIPGNGYISYRLKRFLSIFLTFQFVSFAWLFFRADDMETVGVMLSQIFYSFGAEYIIQVMEAHVTVFTLIASAMLIHWLPSSIKEWYRGKFIKTHIVLKILIVVLMVFVIYQVRSAEVQPFIYFRF